MESHVKQERALQEERALSLLDSLRRAEQRQVCLQVKSEKNLPIYGFSMKDEAKSSAESEGEG